MKSLAALFALSLLAPARGFAQEVPPPPAVAPPDDEDDIEPPPMVMVPVPQPMVPAAPQPIQLLPRLDAEQPPRLKLSHKPYISPERKHRGMTVVVLAHLVQIIGVSLMVPGVIHQPGSSFLDGSTGVWANASTLITAGTVLVLAGNAVEVWGWTILGKKERAPEVRLSLAAAGPKLTF